MTVKELKEKLDKKEDILVLDVREKEEFQFANIGGTLLPLSELTNRTSELDPQKETVVLCHHGMRSSQAVGYLRQLGFEKISNLDGGIDSWSVQIDPKIPRY